MNHVEKITERVNRNGDFYSEQTPTPMLTISEFFEGNDIVGSIGCNLEESPHPRLIESVLKDIKSRDDVLEVYIQITEMDDPSWPFSDTAWVVTSANDSEILNCFPANLAPDEVWEGLVNGRKYESVEIPPGYKILACWWD